MIQSYISPKLEKRESPIQGNGFFAIKPIKKGELVFIKGGYILTRETMISSGKIDSYWPITDDIVLAAEKEDEVEHVKVCMNHSCEPNCGIRGEISCVALRDITVGEEITFDYAMLDNENSYFVCNCGSLKCRHIITGFDWEIKDLQEKYNNSFIAYLKEKISQGIFYETVHDITKEINNFRKAIFIKEQMTLYENEFEGNEDRFIHCCLHKKGLLVAYARLGMAAGIAKIERIAVDKESRKKGLGTQIVFWAEIEARKLHCKTAVLHAQVHAQNFYAKIGYEVVGESFIEAGIPHIKMTKKLD